MQPLDSSIVANHLLLDASRYGTLRFSIRDNAVMKPGCNCIKTVELPATISYLYSKLITVLLSIDSSSSCRATRSSQRRCIMDCQTAPGGSGISTQAFRR